MIFSCSEILFWSLISVNDLMGFYCGNLCKYIHLLSKPPSFIVWDTGLDETYSGQQSQMSSLYSHRVSLTAGTAPKRRTNPKADMTLCWAVSQSFLLVWLKTSNKNIHLRGFLFFPHLTLPWSLFLIWSVSDDRHRVKLHPLLGDSNSDYINANYIDVSAPLFLSPYFPFGCVHAACPSVTALTATVHHSHSSKPTSLLAHLHQLIKWSLFVLFWHYCQKPGWPFWFRLWCHVFYWRGM